MTEYSPNGQPLQSPAPGKPAPAPFEYAEGGISLIGLLNVLLRRRYLIGSLPVIAFAAAFLLTERSSDYVSSSKLLISGGGGQISGRLTGLAEQLGLSVSGGGAVSMNSPGFYAWLIRSKDVLKNAAENEYVVEVAPGDTVRGNLADVYARGELIGAPDLNAAVDLLSSKVETGQDRETGFFGIESAAPWRDLAVQLNRAIITELQEYNVGQKLREASKEREFYEQRMDAAMTELLAMEDSVEEFLRRNRQFYPRGPAGQANSPALDFEFARLQGRLEVRRQVYGSLVNAHEQARLNEARVAPDFTVIEQPENSITLAHEVGRRTPQANGMIAFISALIFAIGLAFLLEYLRGQPQKNPEDFDELRQLTREAVGELLRPDRLLQRVPRFRVRSAELEAAGSTKDEESAT